jgi:UDP-2,3-diacylglucosamine hydrolase
VMIHGHTHRPGRHDYRVAGRDRVRWVLPDWYESGGYLEASPEGIRAVAAC